MGKNSKRNSLTASNGSISNGSTHSDMSSSGSSYGGSSSESDSEKLRRKMKLYDESVLYSEEICKFKSGSSSNLRYNVFGIGKTSIFFYGSFSLKKKRKIIPFKSISAIEWLEDDSIKLTVPIEGKDKPKTYNIHFKASHKGSPYRLIESRWQASKLTSSNKLSTGEELYRNPTTPNLLRHFQNIPKDERLEFSYRCRIKGSLEQNYGILFVTQTRILFLSIDTTFKTEEIKFEKVLEIAESLPGKKGKLKKSILVTIGKNQSYSFSSFENKEETLQQLTRSLDSYKKSIIQQKSISKPINNNSTGSSGGNNTTTTTTTTSTTQPTPTVYAPEKPLPSNSKTTTWTSIKATPTTTSPLTPAPTNLSPKPNNITPAPSGIRPPTTPLLPEKKQENYGDRANKVFPKETATEMKQKEEIKQKGTNKANRNCCSLW